MYILPKGKQWLWFALIFVLVALVFWMDPPKHTMIGWTILRLMGREDW